jgi:hypothetical protein
MADTEHPPIEGPVEGDGVSYRGIVWFIVVLVMTVVVCQVLIWGLFRFTETYRLDRPEIVRAPLAPPAVDPSLQDGQVSRGPEVPASGPALLVDEPLVLQQFLEREEALLHSYGWVNQGAQTVRLPIDRAKDLLLERGLTIRGSSGPAGSTGSGE